MYQQATDPRPLPTSSPPATVRRGAGVLAFLLATGAVTAAVNLLARPLPADDFTSFAEVAPTRDAAWLFGVVAAVATAVAFVTVGLAVCLLARGRGSGAATVGAVLTGIGGIGYACGFFAMSALVWYGTSDELPEAAGPALLSYAGESSGHVFGPQIVGFLMFVLGYQILAVALWRSRAVPRWLPVAIPTTFVLTMLAGSGIAFDVVNASFMGTLVAIAWYLWSRVVRHGPSPAQ